VTEVPRDGWDRPKIIPPDGGKLTAYTRCTTFVGAIEDNFNLTKWEKRQVAIGLADRPDLLLAASAHRDNKDELNKVADKAKEAAKAGAAATTGTALHALTERVDRGEELPALPAEYAADMEVYRRMTQPMTTLEIEKFVVNDYYQVGGTFDRMYGVGGRRYIGDTKTGSRIDYGIGKIVMQLAMYSRSAGYDPENGARHELGVDQDWGIVVHLPAGSGECVPYWVNLQWGWYGVQLAYSVRQFRKLKMKDLTQKFYTEEGA
jgi:hypothetical protein